MGRRISDSDPSGKKPCAFCRTMRVVLIFAVMVVMLMAYANKLQWLKNIDFTRLFGYLVVAFFFTVLGYRVWDEYGRPKQSFAQLEEKRLRREKQFDELDALEAERAEIKHAEAQLNEKVLPEIDGVDEIEVEIEFEAKAVVETEVKLETELNVEAELNVETEVEVETDTEMVSEKEPEQLDLLGFATQKKSD